MEINFKQCNLANYQKGRKDKIKFIVIHYTANYNDTANNNAVYFAREALKNPASAHYFVDESSIWQSVADTDTAWHCGGGRQGFNGGADWLGLCTNNNSIGIEMCLLDKNGNVRQGTIDTAVWLTRELMQTYGIDADHVIRHYDVTGKNCPAPMVEDAKLWNEFKERIEDMGNKIYKYVQEMPDWAQDTFARLIQSGYIAKDEKGEVSVEHSSLQPMVYLDRLTGSKLEKLPELIKMLEVMKNG